MEVPGSRIVNNSCVVEYDQSENVAKGLIELISANSTPYNHAILSCTGLYHFSQLDRDGEQWSCGYRNFQMLCSSLLQHDIYRRVMFDGSGRIPTVMELQGWIEQAWSHGFDIDVCE